MSGLISNRSQVRWLALFASLAILAVYSGMVLSLSLNIPYLDDFQDILIFVVTFHEAGTFHEAASALTHQHADHLTFSSRLIYYLVYLLEGEVNFRTLTVIAHVGLVVIAWLFYLQINNHSQLRPMFLVCLLLLLFHPRAYTLVNWPMAAFQWYLSYCYVLASLYLLSREDRGAYAAAVLTAVLASFSMATGQLVWVIGALVILKRRREPTFPFRPLLISWLSTAAMVLLIFHAIYEPVLPTRELLRYFISEPLVILQTFFAFTGSAVGMGSMLWSQVLGAVALFAAAGFLVQGIKGHITPLHAFLIYCLASISIIVLGRAFMAAAFNTMVLEPRYSFASIMLWTTLFVLVVNQLRTVGIGKVTVLIAVCAALNIGCYIKFIPSLEQHQLWRIDYYNRLGMQYSPIWPTTPTLTKAAQLGIYFPPERPYKPD